MKRNATSTLEILNQHSTGNYLDAAGIVASWMCAVHCLVLPLFISILPLVGLSFLLDETTEFAFIFATIVIALLSLLPAYFKQHGKLRSLVLFVNGIFLIVVSHILFEENFTARAILLLSGGLLITIAHITNRRLCRSCIVCTHTETQT